MKPLLIAFLLGSLVWPSGLLWAQEWAQFRGKDGKAHGKGAGIPSQFTAGDYVWVADLEGMGHSSPVIWGNRLFVTWVKGDKTRHVVAYDAKTGMKQWEWGESFQAHGKHRLNEYASSTPCVDRDRVYLTWTSGDQREAIALNHEGEMVWRKILGPFEGDHGGGSSPLLVDGVLLTFWDHLSGRTSYGAGLDAATGEAIWQDERVWPATGKFKTTYSTPCVYRNSKGETEVILSSMIYGVESWNPKTGKVNWEYNHTFGARTVASPVVGDGVIFATWGSGNGAKDHVALIPGSETKSGKPKVAWRKVKSAGGPDNRGFPYVPSPLAAGKLFYFWADSGIFHAVRAKTGEVVLEPARVSGEYYSNPILIGDRIFCASRNQGEMVVLKAGKSFEDFGLSEEDMDMDEGSGTPKSNKWPELGRSKLGSGVNATPAISQGRMYIRTEKKLICLGAR